MTVRVRFMYLLAALTALTLLAAHARAQETGIGTVTNDPPGAQPDQWNPGPGVVAPTPCLSARSSYATAVPAQRRDRSDARVATGARPPD